MKPKTNIFKQYFYAVAQPQKYSELSRLGGGRLFLFTLILAIVITITYVTPVASYFYKHNGVNGLLKEYIPDYTYKDGLLQLDFTYDGYSGYTNLQSSLTEEKETVNLDSYFDNIEPFLFYYILRSIISEDEANAQDPLSSDFYLYVNTDINSVNDINFDEMDITAKEGLFVTKTDYILYPVSYYSSNQESISEAFEKKKLETKTFSELFGKKEYSKDSFIQEIMKYTPVYYIISFICFILITLFLLAGWYFAALFFSIIALIINNLLHKNLSYGTLYKISVYAQVTAITLVTLNTIFTLVNPTIFTWIGRFITVIYIVLSLFFIKGITVFYQEQEQLSSNLNENPDHDN